MKTTRQRHDADTDFLFKRESQLFGNFRREAPDVRKQLKTRFDKLAKSGIATSQGLDRFLQVAMAWLTTYLGSKKGQTQPTFRATISLYLQFRQAILVKPCLVYPGRCRPPQPTIAVPDEFGGPIGHTGVSMYLGRILYCRPADAECTQYIPLDPDFELPSQKTVAALCIPLEGDYNDLTIKFEKEGHNGACSMSKDLCSHARRKSAQRKQGPKSRWALNIECLSQDLTRDFAGELLSDPEFSEVIEKMIETLAEYQKQRDMHRALERSSTLLALATNTLKPRSAYRALLREISNACDGADVTLHLRDLFDGTDAAETQRNRDRCSVFVTGVGTNFRDFLINERIGLKNGQIGWALDDEIPPDGRVSKSTLDLELLGESGPEKVRVQYIVGKEIEHALNGRADALPYKQLMPNTFLNVAVPIYFHTRKIGVINLEWDLEHLHRGCDPMGLKIARDTADGSGRADIQCYLSDRLRLVYRMADYLSLVIDYFDDIEHLAPPPSSKDLSKPDFVRSINRDGALRGVMRYYVHRAMTQVDKLAEKGTMDKSEAERACLQDLVDAVGYFLANATQLRILVSVRRTLNGPTGRLLEHSVSHWLEGLQDEQQADRMKSIPIRDMTTVLATSAYRGICLFGQIETEGEKKQLRLDPTWLELHKHSEDSELKTVPYSPSGPEPRHEIGVPLVFGKSVLGTFDFEQFALESSDKGVLPLTERDVCAHLQWGRAITFLIAYLEDARTGLGERPAAFKRFQLLCAQLIAEVPVEEKQLRAIAADAFAEIVPVKEVRLETKPPDPGTDTGNRRIAPLRFRGGGDHRLSWELDEDPNALLESESEADPGKTVTAMMTSYFALIESLKPQELGDGKFLAAMDEILRDLELNEASLPDVSFDAGQSALKVFSFLDASLRRYLLDPATDPKVPRRPSDYAWFLHVRRYDPETGLQTWTCNPDDIYRPPESETPARPLAYCYTKEMREILDKTKERVAASQGKDKTPEPAADHVALALSQVLEERARGTHSASFDASTFARVVDAITAGLESDLTEETLVAAITARLSRPKSDGNESGEGKKALGFTQSVYKAERPIVVPEYNLSPNRSERDHGWFWEHTYTVIGIPFMLGRECLAVLNVFRRRESNSDMNFFRLEERDKAGELAKSVKALFERLLTVDQFDRPTDEPLRAGFSRLSSELNGLVATGKKLIVVQSPFARSHASFEVLAQIIFGKDAKFDELRKVHLPEDERSYTDRNVLLRIGKDYKNEKDGPKQLKQLGQELGSITDHARCVFLFVASSEDIEWQSVPVYASHVRFSDLDESLLQRDIREEEELYYRWLLGTAMVSLSAGTKLLCRRDGPWSHSRFRDWVLERGRASERADFYSASGHLRKQSSWRPSNQILSLGSWGGQEEKTGETQ